MTQYLLALHSDGCSGPGDMSPEDMQASMAKIQALEADMKSTGTWVFSGKLTDPASATVVRSEGGKAMMTDGPYMESKEHLGGFYIIEAADLDKALTWATRVTECIGMAIEVRPLWSMPT